MKNFTAVSGTFDAMKKLKAILGQYEKNTDWETLSLSQQDEIIDLIEGFINFDDVVIGQKMAEKILIGFQY